MIGLPTVYYIKADICKRRMKENLLRRLHILIYNKPIFCCILIYHSHAKGCLWFLEFFEGSFLVFFPMRSRLFFPSQRLDSGHLLTIEYPNLPFFIIKELFSSVNFEEQLKSFFFEIPSLTPRHFSNFSLDVWFTSEVFGSFF